MDFSHFQTYCKDLVRDYMLAHGRDGYFEVYLVWYSKTLQNAKALLTTNIADDSRYFEITYDGDRDKFYVDCYVKESNVVFEGEEVHG